MLPNEECPMFKNKLVSIKELKTVCGIPYSRQHIRRLELAGQFPQRVRLGQNRVAYRLADIEAWIQERLEDD